MQRVLIFEPHAGLREQLLRAVRSAGYDAEPAAQREQALSLASSGAFDAALVDVSGADDLEAVETLARASRPLAVLATGSRPSVAVAVEAMKCGARDFLGKPFSVSSLESALDSVLAATRRRTDEAREDAILTSDPAMERVLAKARAAATTEATLLIVGESGTGKDLLARFVHFRSPRRSGPLVAVNCAALPEALVESELFGHERGAFTGADEARRGQVSVADGGTLLLDEIGEIPRQVQPKLLRMLQEREVQPVGALAPRSVDVRIVATTHRDLQAEVAAGRFREDLYYRIEVIVLRLPPLRERPADIPLLASHFLNRFAEPSRNDPPLLGARAIEQLRRHEFRGNVRELENLMRRAVVLYPGREIDVERILGRPGAGVASAGGTEGSHNLREAERRVIVRCLADTGGNRTHASQALGISVRTLRNKIRLYNLA